MPFMLFKIYAIFQNDKFIEMDRSLISKGYKMVTLDEWGQDCSVSILMSWLWQCNIIVLHVTIEGREYMGSPCIISYNCVRISL
jgi:hypothetical protein